MSTENLEKSEQPFSLREWLIVSCTFSFVLLAVRVTATAHITYVFLLWNLFLAFIPYAISNWLHANIDHRNKLKKIVAAAIWLLFIPNSFYLLTDLFHLQQYRAAPKWFDLLLLLSFAWNGLLFGVASLRNMETVVFRVSGRNLSVAVVFGVMWLNAFGIYLGRFLRYNSWDVIVQPVSLFSEMIAILRHPFANKMEWSMITCYAVFMALLYITFKKLGESFHAINNHSIKINK